MIFKVSPNSAFYDSHTRTERCMNAHGGIWQWVGHEVSGSPRLQGGGKAERAASLTKLSEAGERSWVCKEGPIIVLTGHSLL